MVPIEAEKVRGKHHNDRSSMAAAANHTQPTGPTIFQDIVHGKNKEDFETILNLVMLNFRLL